MFQDGNGTIDFKEFMMATDMTASGSPEEKLRLDRQTNRQRDKKTKRQRDKETKRQRDKETNSQTDKHANRQTNSSLITNKNN